MLLLSLFSSYMLTSTFLYVISIYTVCCVYQVTGLFSIMDALNLLDLNSSGKDVTAVSLNIQNDYLHKLKGTSFEWPRSVL